MWAADLTWLSIMKLVRFYNTTFIAIALLWCIKTWIDKARGRFKTYYFHFSGWMLYGHKVIHENKKNIKQNLVKAKTLDNMIIFLMILHVNYLTTFVDLALWWNIDYNMYLLHVSSSTEILQLNIVCSIL